MSFTEYDDAFVWECNDCGKEVIFPPADFSDCVGELKQRGWSFHRTPSEWGHRCSPCTRKARERYKGILDRPFKTV